MNRSSTTPDSSSALSALIRFYHIIIGSLPKRALRLVQDWAKLHAKELNADWQRVVNKELPAPPAGSHPDRHPQPRCTALPAGPRRRAEREFGYVILPRP